MVSEDQDMVIDWKGMSEGAWPSVPATPPKWAARLVGHVNHHDGLVPRVTHIHILQYVLIYTWFQSFNEFDVYLAILVNLDAAYQRGSQVHRADTRERNLLDRLAGGSIIY